MLKRVFLAAMFILVSTGMLTMAFKIQPAIADPKTWIVDDDGPADFHTIGEAITAAANGDTVYVRNGTYNEHIAMYDKFDLRILGEDNNYTIIDGNGLGPIVTIFEGSNVTFANFTVRNAGYTPNLDEGIRLRYTSSNTIANCIVTGCGFGIFEQEYYDFGGRNIIIGNTVSDCTEIAIGSSWESLIGDIVANNTITNSTNFGIYFNNPSNVQIVGNHIFGTESQYSQYGIHLQVGGSNNTIIGNRIEYSGNAIRLDYADGNVVEENIVENCTFGVFVGYESSNNIVVGNNASSSSIGFMLWDNSNDNIVANNLATNNGYGVALSSSNSNRIYHNNFLNNVQQVLSIDGQPNVWDEGYPSGGNFWSDYSGPDFFNGPYQNVSGSDGIGDTPYVTDENNTDRYPLMNQYQPSHDIAITDTLTIKTVIGQGYSLNLTVTAANQGDSVETFNVTIYANTTSIASQNIILPSLISSNITITLDTTGLAYGNYTLSAYAYPVLGETNTINNNYTCTTSIHVGVPGDISGPSIGVYDGTVNMRDIQYLILLFNTNPSSPNWKPNADINNDGTVNMRDIQIAILNFNKHE